MNAARQGVCNRLAFQGVCTRGLGRGTRQSPFSAHPQIARKHRTRRWSIVDCQQLWFEEKAEKSYSSGLNSSTMSLRLTEAELLRSEVCHLQLSQRAVNFSMACAPRPAFRRASFAVSTTQAHQQRGFTPVSSFTPAWESCIVRLEVFQVKATWRSPRRELQQLSRSAR